jgi:hypothetical protein
VPGKIFLLLERGADVGARDRESRTCLHLIFSGLGKGTGLGSVFHAEMILKDILMSMVTAGADVNAIDFVGRSVSEVACLAGYEKLWMEVLGECGYDIAPVYESLNCFCESHTNPETEIFATTLWNIGPDKLTFAEYRQHWEMQRRVWIAAYEKEAYIESLRLAFWSIDDISHRQQSMMTKLRAALE